MEQLLTKYFWVFNITSLLAISFFMADGTGELIAAKVQTSLPASNGPSPTTVRPKRKTTRPSRFDESGGQFILKRNIFDSTMGPVEELDLSEVPDGETTEQTGDLPLVPCTNSKVKLLATVASPEYQEWSFASIDESGKKTMCRVGDSVDNRTVSGITWRYLFLKGSSNECYIDMYDDGKGTPPPRKRTAKEEPSSGDSFKDGVQVVSETERIVDRALVDKVLADPTQFIRSVRVRPQKKNGKVVGFKLRRFKKDSPLSLLGAQKGDVIHSVNGIDLTSVDKALGAYQSLRSTGDLSFSITRKGKPLDLSIRIK